jgi:hypothetical protein
MLITESKRATEFEVQAFLYHELRTRGFHFRGEQSVYPPAKQGQRQRKCRLDLAQIEKGMLLGVIEVKRSRLRQEEDDRWFSGPQGKRYSALGVPLIIVRGMADARALVAKVEGGKPFPWPV